MSPLRSFAVLILILLAMSAASYVRADGCGDIIVPENFNGLGGPEERTPIADCTNPFNRDATVGFDASLSLGTQAVGEDSTLTYAATTTEVAGKLIFSYPDVPFYLLTVALYRRDGANFYLVEEAKFDRPSGEYLFTWDTVAPGLYEAIIVYEPPPLLVPRPPSTGEGWFWWLLPTAHAYYQNYQEVKQIAFTVTFGEPPPAGASSVLFLPGIQASRLYKDGLFGIEDRVWEPNSLFSNDVRDLSMNEDGESEKEIYTRDVIDRAVGTDVYRDFLEMLEEQKTATVPIKDFVAFAYDWRFSVTDIIQNGTAYEEEIKQVQAEVERLAAESHSGQVTIIAHSNGGLLAKALIRSLEAVDKEHLVDRLVFLGTPQLGTPKAIATLLHGYDQSDAYGGLIISAGSARTVANNLPGLYALLPSERYVAEMTGPIIRFEQGTPTDPYRSLYGSEINSFLQYQTFLYGSDVFDRGLDEMVSVPTRVNPTLFNTAMQEHSEWMDAWEAPASIDVVEIVGVGLPTLSAITYRSIPERKCAVVGSGMILCVTEYDIKPYANFTVQGDETVVADSARGYVGDKQTFFVALNQLSDARLSSGLSAISHFNELPRRKRTGYQWSFELVKSEGVAWCICV